MVARVLLWKIPQRGTARRSAIPLPPDEEPVESAAVYLMEARSHYPPYNRATSSTPSRTSAFFPIAKAATVHRTVREHFETYLGLVIEFDPVDGGVSPHVENPVRSFLRSGILAHGFARARWPSCGYDFLVGCSGNRGGTCLSRNAKRLAETAAHLVSARTGARVDPLCPQIA